MTKKTKNDPVSPLAMFIVSLIGLHITWRIWDEVVNGNDLVGGPAVELPRILLVFITLALASINIVLFTLGYKAAVKSNKLGWKILYIFVISGFSLYIIFLCSFFAFFHF